MMPNDANEMRPNTGYSHNFTFIYEFLWFFEFYKKGISEMSLFLWRRTSSTKNNVYFMKLLVVNF